MEVRFKDQQALNDWDEEEGSKIWKLGDWEDNSAIEINKVKREAVLYRAIAQRQEMKAFEWVKYTVKAPHAKKMVYG